MMKSISCYCSYRALVNPLTPIYTYVALVQCVNKYRSLWFACDYIYLIGYSHRYSIHLTTVCTGVRLSKYMNLTFKYCTLLIQ